VAVALEEEAGKIDLNGAPPEFLQAALVGLGLGERKARDVAQAIVAYRTTQAGAFGQIAPTPPSDKPIPPKQGLFETVMELDQVSGVDPALFRALLPFVTVHSRTAGVDARSSPPALFAALSGYPGENVRALAAAPFPNNLKRTDPRFPANFNQAGDRGAFLIHAEVMLATGQTIARDAILDLRPTNGAQYALREIRLGQSKYGDRLRAMIVSNGAGVPDC
jgi:general secretion pathway protein K